MTFTPDSTTPEPTPDPTTTGSTAPETSGTAPETSGPGRRRRWPFVAAATVVALGLAGGATAYGTARKTVALDVDGQVQQVTTTAADVDGLLEAQGVTVDDRDLVAPGQDAALSEGDEVVVRTGKELSVDVDGERTDAWVAAADTDEALDSLSARGEDVSIVASRSGDRASLPVDVDVDGPVAVVHDGKTEFVDGASDVAAVLAEAGVTLDGDDRVSVTDTSNPDVKKAVSQAAAEARKQAGEQSDAATATVEDVAAEATDGPTASATSASAASDPTEQVATGAETPQVAVVVQRVETKNVTTTKAIAHDSTTKKSDERYSDQDPKVTTEGKDGERTIVQKVTTVDGKTVKKTKVSDEVTTKPVTEVVVKGTKERPEPETETETETETSSYSGSPKAIGQQMAAERGWTGSEWTALESLWDKESGWSTTAANPTSSAYGIPQALPGSKMSSAGSDWQTNPATQIEWGLNYIADVYGSPSAAWAHSQANNWY